MRKLIVQEFVSIDGFAASLDGGIKFMEIQGLNTPLEMEQCKLMESVDLIVLGRKTYEMFAPYWPVADEKTEPIAVPIRATPWLVFSNTLNEAPRGHLSEAAISKNDPVAEINRLKQQPGGNIILWGSLAVVQQLLEAGCVDELHLIVYPSVLGTGLRFFPKAGLPEELKLISAEVFDGRATLLRYVANGQ